MSTIGNGILGTVQNQAPAKGKAGHGKAAAGGSNGVDFASAVASLSGREGDSGQKGGRVSISGNVKQAVDTRHAATEHGDGLKAGLPDAHSIRDVLRKAGAEASGTQGKSFAEKAAALLDAASRPDGKTRTKDGGERGADVRDADEAAADDAADAAADGVTAAADVGNLLEMLAPAHGMPHAQAAAAAAAGGDKDVKAEAAAKASGKAGMHADAAAKADAASGADAEDLPQSDTDQLFRLVRADGKGRDLDMSLSGDGDRAKFRDANVNGAKGETVTVVDSRRYIGLAQAGNSAAVTTAIVQDPEWAQSLGATGGLAGSGADATGKVVNMLKIQMHPIELGLVTATLRLHGDELTVALQVQTGEAYRQLKDDQDAIVKALRDQGFAVDQVSVQLTPADKSAGSQQQGDGQNQQQFSSQPQAREGGNSRQGGGEQGAGNFGREDTSHEGNTSETAPGLAGGQSVRTGGVYL